MPVVLHSVVGDSLGKKYFLGWHLIWTHDYFCPNCETKYDDSLVTYRDVSSPRTVDTHNRNVANAWEDRTLNEGRLVPGNCNGVRKLPILCDPACEPLAYFHPAKNLHYEVSFF